MKNGIGTKEKPMVLKTPLLSSEFTMPLEEKDGKEVLVCTVGKTILFYDYRCLTDLHAMLKKHGDWMELGSADDRDRQRKELLKLGDLLKKIRLAVGMN